jgi:hypothetical protein
LRTFIGFRGTPAHMWSFAVAEFTSREMHVVKRALAIAALAVERVTERSHSDDANLKELLIKLVKSDVERVMYTPFTSVPENPLDR